MLTNINYPSADSAMDVSISYDNYGRRSGMTDGTGTVSYDYDELNNPLGVTTTYNGLPAQNITYTYNPDGSRSGMSVPTNNGQGWFTYNYDAARRMVGLTNPNGQTSSWTYQNNNWLQQQALGNGAYTNYSQDPIGELNGMANYSASGIAYSVYSGFGYDGLRISSKCDINSGNV